MSSNKILIVSFLILLSLMVKTANSECCKHACCGNFRCCGVGKCNIFCCNCNNGCRHCSLPWWKTLSNGASCLSCAKGNAAACVKCVHSGKRRDMNYFEDRTVQTIMDEADENEDGFMDVLEAAEFLAGDNKLHMDEVERVRRDANEMPKWFLQMDMNGDGLIAPHELDN